MPKISIETMLKLETENLLQLEKKNLICYTFYMDKKIIADGIQLNKYVASSGLCSRKKADELIKNGEVTVNHWPEKNPGYIVQKNDTVRHDKKPLKPTAKVYIVLNKPKNTITTTSDDFGRRTVIDLIDIRDSRLLHTIGRLDKDTTGIILITNDGELTQKLSHPKYECKKIYHATLNRRIENQDLERIKKGINLEDGFIKPDKIFVPPKTDGTKVVVHIHSGRNRIIKRMFRSAGYFVETLDRTVFGSISKKSLPTGYWRILTEKEVKKLKS